MIFFTADNHFRHENVIKYEKRPFKDLLEMEAIMVRNWIDRVNKEDHVIIVGDFSFLFKQYRPDCAIFRF